MPEIVLKNIKGRHGKDGVQGPIGLRGPQGEQGKTGNTGAAGVGERGPQGDKGATGAQGERGLQGLSGAVGVQGEAGRDGGVGEAGGTPEHRWEGESLQFKHPDGKWGKKRNLQGRGFVGGGPSSAGVKYNPVTTATLTFTDRDLVAGMNIFGINYNGNVTITLPAEISPEKIIIIKDESGNASSNNITIQTA